MSAPHRPDDVIAYNSRELEELAWAIEASVGQFKLFLARCNYTNLRSQLVERLRELTSVEIRVLKLKASEKTLFTRIQAELDSEQLDALMVLGLESVGDIERMLPAINQVREEFRKHFHFPLVIWVNDEIYKKLLRLAPDFESWATTTEFLVATDELIDLLRQADEQFFKENLILDSKACQEIKLACHDLQSRQQALDLEFRAIIESLLGMTEYVNKNLDIALEHYQKALEWQQSNNLERQGQLLKNISFCYYLKALQHQEENHPDWQATKHYLQQAIEVFEKIQRPDLIANLTFSFNRVLQHLQDWEQLQTLAQSALQLHQTENKPIELAQDYGFLAEVALAKKRWTEAKELAEKALEVLSAVSSFQSSGIGVVDELPDKSVISYDSSRYRFILGQSQQHLDQPQEAIRNLEVAKRIGSPGDTQLYLDILYHLQKLYFEQKEYLKAFEIKLERQSIEQQYGLRAFVGAGRIQPQRQAELVTRQIESQEAIAPEITASGRLLDVERLIERIGRNDCKLIVIHGESGVGKSSLVYGGLVPALKQKAIGTSDVLPVPMRVYTSWVEELGKLLAEALAEKGIRLLTPLDSEATILEQLQHEPHNLRTVLIFDQLEEFFFVYPDLGERRRFFEFLGECLNILPVKVILSLREDYLHYLLECDRLPSMKIIGNDILARNARYQLGNFLPADTRVIIQRLTKLSNFQLEPALIEQLVQDLAGRLGEVRPIELQIVGAQLQTENITTLTQYRERGPKKQLVERYLEEVVVDCGSENREAAWKILSLLTDKKGTRPLKTRGELAAALKLETANMDLILKILVESGLVFRVQEKPEDRYQLVHDYLVEPIRQKYDFDLEAQLEEAKEANRILAEAQQEARRTIKRGFAGLAVISVVAITVVAWAGITLKQTQEDTKIERAGVDALRQFESGTGETEALLSATRVGQDLKKRVKDDQRLENYPAISPLVALQKILDKIQERNQLNADTHLIGGVSFSLDGKLIVTADREGIVQLWNSSGQQLKQWKSGSDWGVRGVGFSPDGRLIAAGGVDRKVRLWNLSGKLLAEWHSDQGQLLNLRFSPNGKLIATRGEDGSVRLWNLTGKLLAEWQSGRNWSFALSFSPDGKVIATAGRNGTVQLWNLSGKQLAEWQSSQNGVDNLSISPDGKLIATVGGADGTVRLWDLSGKQQAEWEASQEHLRSVEFSPDGQRLVTGGDEGAVRLWDLSGKQLAEWKSVLGGTDSVSFSPDGERVAVGGSTVRLLDVSESPIANWDKGWVEDVSFSPDWQRITVATRHSDNQIRLWDISGKQLAELRSHLAFANASFSPDGQRIATTTIDFFGDGNNATARLWDLSGKQLAELKGKQGSVNQIIFSPDGKLIATVGLNNRKDTTVQLWDVSGKQLAELKGKQGSVSQMSFSPNGKLIATGAEKDGTIRIWNLLGEQMAEWKGHQGWVSQVSFSPDGQRLATGGEDGTVRLWNLSGKLLAKFKSHPGGVTELVFGRDGKQLATIGSDSTVRLWDLSGLLAEFIHGSVRTVSFSPDGQRIATAGADKTVRLWVTSGQQLAEFKVEDAVYSVSFSPDGKRLAAKEGTVKLWRVEELDELLERGCNWLQDYLVSHPEALETLEVCHNKASFIAAAPVLVTQGEALATGDVEGAITIFRKAKTWNPNLNLDPKAEAQRLALQGQAQRLVEEGEELAGAGDIEGAVARFQKSLELDSSLEFNPKTKARQLAALALFAQGEELAKTGNIKDAVTKFQKALELDPSLDLKPETKARRLADQAVLKKGFRLAIQGEVKKAIAAYAEAQKLAPKVEISANSWNMLCRQGSLRGYAKDVTFACEKAVALAPNDRGIRDSRGLARALTGNTKGAIEDFEAFIASTNDKESKSQRQRWINALSAGKNPFTDEELKSLLPD